MGGSSPLPEAATASTDDGEPQRGQRRAADFSELSDLKLCPGRGYVMAAANTKKIRMNKMIELDERSFEPEAGMNAAGVQN